MLNNELYGTKIMNPMSVVTMDTIDTGKKPLVIYHANCADGFSAAWCFHNKYGDLVEYHPGVYSEVPPDCTGRLVYLVDFSYKRAVVKAICAIAEQVILIDHHKTAIDDLAPLLDRTECSGDYQANFSWYTDINRSGAMLAWDYLHNSARDIDYNLVSEEKPGSDFYDAPPLLLNHIQDRDLWTFKLPLTREISASVFSYGYTFEAWDKLMSADQVELLKISVAGAAIERKHHKDVSELVKVCQRIMTIGEHDVHASSLPYTLTSDAGHLMASGYKDGTVFAACYWDTTDRRVFSLRSTDNGMDVSAIASQYGGGGHRNAAGFSVPRDHALAIA